MFHSYRNKITKKPFLLKSVRLPCIKYQACKINSVSFFQFYYILICASPPSMFHVRLPSQGSYIISKVLLHNIYIYYVLL